MIDRKPALWVECPDCSALVAVYLLAANDPSEVVDNECQVSLIPTFDHTCSGFDGQPLEDEVAA